MGNDIFCTMYERWKREGKVIFENRTAYSIFSVTPAVPGHAIIIAKDHVETLGELNAVEVANFTVIAVRDTLESIRTRYDEDPQAIVEFYKSLRDNPPTAASADLARRMLEHEHLTTTPLSRAYNYGINVGLSAGQTIPHLHAQLIPRRRGQGPGIVTAMRDMLSS